MRARRQVVLQVLEKTLPGSNCLLIGVRKFLLQVRITGTADGPGKIILEESYFGLRLFHRYLCVDRRRILDVRPRARQHFGYVPFAGDQAFQPLIRRRKIALDEHEEGFTREIAVEVWILRPLANVGEAKEVPPNRALQQARVESIVWRKSQQCDAGEFFEGQAVTGYLSLNLRPGVSR